MKTGTPGFYFVRDCGPAEFYVSSFESDYSLLSLADQLRLPARKEMCVILAALKEPEISFCLQHLASPYLVDAKGGANLTATQEVL